MKKLLVPVFLLALSTQAHASWLSSIVSDITPGGWIESQWDRAFDSSDKDGIVATVPEINTAWMLGIGVGLIALRLRIRMVPSLIEAKNRWRSQC